MRPNNQNFGLSAPVIDFEQVRDGRRSMPLWMDIDLSVARSITGTGANAALILNISGNSFYIDADTTNIGTGILHFQDTSLGIASAPFFVAAGFVASVPFTQVLIENTAQPGKRLRIFYGVDVDFRAGVNSSVISGTVNIGNALAAKMPIYEAGFDYTGSYKSNTGVAANTPDTIFAAGANINGAIIWSFTDVAFSAAGITSALIAKATAPATVIDGDVVASSMLGYTSTLAQAQLQRPVKIAAGKGLYYIASAASATVVLRHCLYTLL